MEISFPVISLRFSVLAAFFLAATPAWAAETVAPAAPALWRIADEDSTVYLFGAIGLSPDGARWRSRALSRAIDQSETVWLEAPVDEPAAQAAANSIFTRDGFAAENETLSSTLPEDAAAALPDIAAKAGIAIETLEPLKPWAAFVVLSSRLAAETAEQSVDAALLAEARGRGRELRYFSSVEDSLRILTEMPPETQEEMAAELIGDFDRQREGAKEAFSAWRAGDLEATDAYLNAALRDRAPAVYERLIANRVDAFAAGFEAVLAAPGASLVLLNPAYLAGPDALPEKLAEMGYSVERLAD